MKRISQGLTALLLFFGSSCSTAIPGAETASRSFGFTQFADTNDDGLPDTRTGIAAGTVADFDDDGKNGDVRGRRENILGESGWQASIRTQKPSAPTLEKPNLDRKMIYSASFAVMVATVDDAVSKLLEKVQALGGYLSQRQNSTLTVRVPADKFQSLVAAIPGFGRVVSESMNAADVTSQHTDLTIRLENAEKSRKRLLALIEKATRMEDIIKIEEALRRITTEIERMKGQLKLMNNKIAYSTVSVAFQANAPQAWTKKRTRSRFGWINRIGIEQDLQRF